MPPKASHIGQTITRAFKNARMKTSLTDVVIMKACPIPSLKVIIAAPAKLGGQPALGDNGDPEGNGFGGGAFTLEERHA
jgi:hypothetical protein